MTSFAGTAMTITKTHTCNPYCEPQVLPERDWYPTHEVPLQLLRERRHKYAKDALDLHDELNVLLDFGLGRKNEEYHIDLLKALKTILKEVNVQAWTQSTGFGRNAAEDMVFRLGDTSGLFVNPGADLATSGRPALQICGLHRQNSSRGFCVCQEMSFSAQKKQQPPHQKQHPHNSATPHPPMMPQATGLHGSLNTMAAVSSQNSQPQATPNPHSAMMPNAATSHSSLQAVPMPRSQTQTPLQQPQMPPQQPHVRPQQPQMLSQQSKPQSMPVQHLSMPRQVNTLHGSPSAQTSRPSQKPQPHSMPAQHPSMPQQGNTLHYSPCAQTSIPSQRLQHQPGPRPHPSTPPQGRVPQGASKGPSPAPSAQSGQARAAARNPRSASNASQYTQNAPNMPYGSMSPLFMHGSAPSLGSIPQYMRSQASSPAHPMMPAPMPQYSQPAERDPRDFPYGPQYTQNDLRMSYNPTAPHFVQGQSHTPAPLRSSLSAPHPARGLQNFADGSQYANVPSISQNPMAPHLIRGQAPSPAPSTPAPSMLAGSSGKRKLDAFYGETAQSVDVARKKIRQASGSLPSPASSRESPPYPPSDAPSRTRTPLPGPSPRLPSIPTAQNQAPAAPTHVQPPAAAMPQMGSPSMPSMSAYALPASGAYEIPGPVWVETTDGEVPVQGMRNMSDGMIIHVTSGQIMTRARFLQVFDSKRGAHGQSLSKK